MPDNNIINKVFNLISGGIEGGDDKSILLRQLAKEVPQNKYAKFYRSRQEEADPSFAQYFCSIYKLIRPLRLFLSDPAVLNKIKQVTLESYIDKPVMELIKRLGRDAVAERKKSAGPNFVAELEKELAMLAAGFDSPRLATADNCYNMIMFLARFVNWDYPNMLRKFDPEFVDDLSITPKFTPLRLDLIMMDIASFYSIMPSFDPKDDWKTVFAILKFCKGGTDIVPLEVWNGLLSNLRDLKNSRMLDLMVKLGSGNPVWDVKPAPDLDEQLSSGWLADKTAEIRQIIMSIADSQKSAQITALEKAVFGANDITRLTYYTKERGRVFEQKDVETYIFAPAMNHLFAFVEDFVKKEMQELADILLVRGQWTNNAASITMSDALHTVVEITPDIVSIDESLAEDGSNGPRLRGALLRVDRDPSQAKYLDSIINMVNEDALNVINRVIPSCVIIGKHLKQLLDDCQKKPFELIINWKELTLASKTPMVQRLGDDYKKFNYFIQLMLLETKTDDE